jgi:hypothetical protein
MTYRKIAVMAIVMTSLCAAATTDSQAFQPPKEALARVFDVTEFGAKPDAEALQTEALQSAINAAAAAGGGLVTLPAGRFRSGSLFLKDHVILRVSEKAVLEGSQDWRDYGTGQWTNALITAAGVHGVSIIGSGVIDGMGVERKGGEEGFRGPHTLFFSDAQGIRIEGVVIRNSGNYSIMCRDSKTIELSRVTIHAGHDGLHAQNCEDITVKTCDFRTGDDCIAGTDNRNVIVQGCRFNSSCNAFRLGAFGLLVRTCVFQGPGQYPHKVSVRRGAPRNNMLAAFVHFSPQDRKPQWPSDNWIIEDCTMDQVQAVYAYDHERGLWQTGQPAKRIRFTSLKATRVARPVRIVGDAARQLDLTLENVAIALDDAHAAQPVLDVRKFAALRLGGLTLGNDGTQPLILAADGDLIQWLCDADAKPPSDRVELKDVRTISATIKTNLLPMAAENNTRSQP